MEMTYKGKKRKFMLLLALLSPETDVSSLKWLFIWFELNAAFIVRVYSLKALMKKKVM